MGYEQDIAPQTFSGVTIGRKIFMALTTPLGLLNGIVHEGGHVLASEMPFHSGRVLSPEEARTRSVSLTDTQREFLASNTFIEGRIARPNSPEFARIVGIAAQLIRDFTKGTFDPSCLALNYGDSVAEDLRKLGQSVRINPARQRQIELPAYYIQIGCLTLLRASLPEDVSNRIQGPGTPLLAAHHRALRGAQRAHEHGWIVPSIVIDEPLPRTPKSVKIT